MGGLIKAGTTVQCIIELIWFEESVYITSNASHCLYFMSENCQQASIEHVTFYNVMVKCRHSTFIAIMTKTTVMGLQHN